MNKLHPLPQEQGSILRKSNRFIRSVSSSQSPAPPINVRFFYQSALAIDDPLSPVPLSLSGSSQYGKQAPRPFSESDNQLLNTAWLKYQGEISGNGKEEAKDKGINITTSKIRSGSATYSSESNARPITIDLGRNDEAELGRAVPLQTQEHGIEEASPSDSHSHLTNQKDTATTGTPFIRAPSRNHLSPLGKAVVSERPNMQMYDSYDWSDDMEAVTNGHENDLTPSNPPVSIDSSATNRVLVGVSRLHHVTLGYNLLQMEPVYWSPVGDIAPVCRATWFYSDSMLPVEVEVANLLEAGYVALRPWSETWVDELNSAVDVGALGEMKVVHQLWPAEINIPESRASSAAVWSQTPAQR